MHVEFGLTAARVLEVFADQVTERGGRVSETAIVDERRMWARSILPDVDEVRSGDFVHGGVAIRMLNDQVSVFPYVFRQVCQNGAILSKTLESRTLEELDLVSTEGALETIRECVAVCAAREVFARQVERMTETTRVDADVAVAMLAFASSHSLSNDPQLLRAIMQQFFQEGDRSQFGLANAVTAVAREIRDPEQKWELEELGGGLAIERRPETPDRGGRRARRRAQTLGSARDPSARLASMGDLAREEDVASESAGSFSEDSWHDDRLPGMAGVK